MSQHYSGRISLILLVLGVFLYAIFPIGTRTHMPNLKPGIDMAGGTDLVYEIKIPPGQSVNPELALQVMESLKRRVDPNGVRNLIWRPQPPNRIEIQMPASGNEKESEEVKTRFVAAQEELKLTNVRPAEVIHAVEDLKGDARRDQLNKLADGSVTREKLFGALASAYDQRQAARAAKNVQLDVEKSEEYDKFKAQLDDTNLSISDLQSALDVKPEHRDQKIADIKAKYLDFPARLKAIDDFKDAYLSYQSVKDTIGSAADLKRMLKGSGVLEFHILAQPDISPEEFQQYVKRLQTKGPAVQAGDKYRWYEVMKPQQFGGPTVPYNDKHWVLASITDTKQLINGPGINRWSLEKSYPTIDSNTGKNIIGFQFDPQGAKYFTQLTGSNLHKPMAIMLDDKVLTAPNINDVIGASGVITGNYSKPELEYLINTLNAGSLPAQLADEPISERTVGPQLGKENLVRGLESCGVGLIIVAVFLISYYYLAGVVATFAVVMNVVLILGSLAAINATFTLPGIAGIVLTIGAAVDANVLIFERLREEQHRGLSLRMAMRNAYDRAFSAILDSNVTTLITCFFLIMFGTEEVKGFGLTLLIGLVWSLFTALFVTKTIFGILIDKFGVTELGSLPLSIPAWDKFLKPNIDWMKIVPVFVTISLVLIISGTLAFYHKAKQRELLDIDFASGTSVTVDLKKDTPRTEIEDLLKGDDKRLPAVGVVTVGTSEHEYEIVSPNADSVQVKQAILDDLGDRLALERPSSYDNLDLSIQEAVEKNVVVPITSNYQSLNGFVPPDLARYTGGAAIVLNKIEPPLSPAKVKERINWQRVQPSSEKSSAYASHDFTVEAPTGPDTPTNFAVLLVSDPNLPYAQDTMKWRDELAGPMWQLTKDAVNKPPQLQKVSNFNAAVAGDTTNDAIMALTLSVVVILAYIWLRFGTLKYGTATVVAMLHDTAMVVGFVGLSHYLGHTYIGKEILLIEPVRVNLTIVAAVLTVMSYSMIDTIVVFDRVREIRGKFGHLSRKVINDAINQTLSRTLLTVGTTMATVAVMYFLGGPGIHGFTFVLLMGILVGSYSSIAIAAPILLIGAPREATPKGPARPSAGQLQTVPR